MQSDQTVTHSVWIRCPNIHCAYEWHYTGRFFIYATCPSCRKNVKISQNKVESPQPHKVPRPRETEAFDAPDQERS